MTTILSYLLFPLLMLVTSCQQNTGDQQATGQEVTAETEPDTTGLAKAVFAGGCFWCTEAYFERLKGVESVISGYAGGPEKNPTYEQVSSGLTGHAEAVQVYYDPAEITFAELVEVFFATHDPTTLNRQGPDVGKQYRSVIFYKTQEEKAIVTNYIAKLNSSGKYKNKIVTTVEPLTKFWVAETYHQDYYERNPTDPYVLSIAKPKVNKFVTAYKSKLKPEYVK